MCHRVAPAVLHDRVVEPCALRHMEIEHYPGMTGKALAAIAGWLQARIDAAAQAGGGVFDGITARMRGVLDALTIALNGSPGPVVALVIIIFGMPPVIRLTALGVRGVPEASRKRQPHSATSARRRFPRGPPLDNPATLSDAADAGADQRRRRPFRQWHRSMQNKWLSGVITPLLTPFDDDRTIAEDLYLDHAATCLADGAHYLSPFGTTSEALSISARERRSLLEKLVTTGTARPDRLMPGTGLCSLEETLALTRHAHELGCKAALVLPPFFYVQASDDGLYRYFSALIEKIGADDLRLCLYHIPQNTGIGISPALAARLNNAFPDTVIALKDSSGDPENTRRTIESAPGISVFPGSESLMPEAMQQGGAGCISAGCNSNVRAIRAVYDCIKTGDANAARTAMEQVNRHRKALQDAGLIPALKALKAYQTGDDRWLNLRPPLVDAAAGIGPEIARTLA
ncbi:MAG: dihydrodipicolinate synthase family protein [Roseovarius sp.]|nr:dihydrodipicolinate synthase family protein [Roseovarius sp.]